MEKLRTDVHCQFCHSKDEINFMCGKCRVTRYCSRNCQQQDWTWEHKLVCKEFSTKTKLFQYLNEGGDYVVNDNLLGLQALLKDHPEILNLVNNDEFNCSLLTLSACKNKKNVLSCLLKKEADMNVLFPRIDPVGLTPLHVAAAKNNSEIVKLLLENNAEYKRQSNTGKTPLFLTCEYGHIASTKLLLKHHALLESRKSFDSRLTSKDEMNYIDIPDHLSLTPFFIACQTSNLDLIRLLLKYKANIDSRNNFGESALWVASHQNCIELVKLLLDEGADVNLSAKDGITPLGIASLRNNKEVVELLLKRSDVNLECRRIQDAETPLFICSKLGHLEIARLLLEHKANVNTRNNRNITPLIISCDNKHKDIVRLLLEHQADTEIAMNDGADEVSPLYLSSQYGLTEIVKLLLNHETIDIDRQRKDGKTALHVASALNQTNVVQLLLEMGANINIQTNLGTTPLHLAVDNGHEETIRVLLHHNPAINLKTNKGWAPLHNAVDRNHQESVQLLLQNKADVDVLGGYDAGLTPLYLASSYGYHSIVKILLQYNPHVNTQNDNGVTPLHAAVQSNNIKIVRLLLKHNSSVNLELRKDPIHLGFTPLHIGCMKGYIGIVKLLLQKNASAMAKAANGWTPLHFVAQTNDVEIASLLLHKIRGYGYASTANSIPSPLYLAAELGNEEMVRLLLKKKNDCHFNINQTREGVTALYIASEHGYKNIVKLFLEHRAKVDLYTDRDLSPLFIASENNYDDIVNLILDLKWGYPDF